MMETYITKISHPENLYPEVHVKYKHPYFLEIATFFLHFDYLILLIII